ncbi:MAG: LamG domain-containing protein [Candidatus Aenigmatarchaeota archaeon]
MKKSFTLVEILIVLALISILATILIIILKPGEILKRSRDTQRIGDLNNLDKSIKFMVINEPNFQETTYASSNIVYISLPDSSSTCDSWLNKLPSLPAGWSYRCSATPTNIDGTGWIPFPFSQNPLINISKLPIDPLNQPPYYYSFVVGGSYKLTAKPETNYNFAIDDGGIEPILYEVGTNKRLSTFQSGLVGYWPFDEGSGVIAYDLSGYGNNGTLQNGPQWVDGKLGKALSFDGVDDHVNLGPRPMLDFLNNFTMCTWFNHISGSGILVNNEGKYEWAPNVNQPGKVSYAVANTSPGWNWVVSSNFSSGQWQFYCFTYSSNALIKSYINGINNYVLQGSGNIDDFAPHLNDVRIGGRQSEVQFFNGLIDEVRIYNRALSDDEIKALYEATK